VLREPRGIVKSRASSANKRFGSTAEVIRRHEVSHALKKMDLSREEEQTVERMSRSLVDGLLRGPISDAVRRATDQQTHIATHLGRLSR
jgi:glutamyl-tRNA reductase